MSQVWLVRANSDGSLCDEFKGDGHISIGYSLTVDLTNFSDRDEIKSAFLAANPDKANPSAISGGVNQIENFLAHVEPGDHVLTPTRDRRELMRGIVRDSSPYFVASAAGNHGHPHRRRVDWEKGTMHFDDATLKKHGIYGARLTIKRISEDSAAFWKDVLGQ